MNASGNEIALLHAANYIDPDVAWQIGAKVWPAGTIVFPKVGGALLTNKKRVLGVPGAFDNNIMGLVPTDPAVDPEWLRLWFGQVDLATLANTQALPSIRQSAVGNLRLLVPTSLRRQRDLVVSERRKSELVAQSHGGAAQQVADARKLVRAFLDEQFSGVVPIRVRVEGALPAGFGVARLPDVARLESGHTPSRRHPEWWGGQVPWLALPDIRKLHGKLAHETTENINDAGLANSSARLLPTGTVCLCRDASIGFVTMLGRPMATSQHFANWVCNSERLDPEFLMYAFMASFDYLRELGSGSVLKTIYMPTIKSFHICAPTIEEQRRIACTLRERLAAAETLTARLTERLADIERLPQRLLAAAFGEAA